MKIWTSSGSPVSSHPEQGWTRIQRGDFSSVLVSTFIIADTVLFLDLFLLCPLTCTSTASKLAAIAHVTPPNICVCFCWCVLEAAAAFLMRMYDPRCRLPSGCPAAETHTTSITVPFLSGHPSFHLPLLHWVFLFLCPDSFCPFLPLLKWLREETSLPTSVLFPPSIMRCQPKPVSLLLSITL